MARDKTAMKKALEKRRIINYKKNADDARQKLRISRTVNRLEKVSTELEDIAQQAAESNRGYTAQKARTVKLRIAALSKLADVEFRKLAKVLPDMQWAMMVEEEGDQGQLDTEKADAAREKLLERFAKTLTTGQSQGANTRTH